MLRAEDIKVGDRLRYQWPDGRLTTGRVDEVVRRPGLPGLVLFTLDHDEGQVIMRLLELVSHGHRVSAPDLLIRG